MNGGANVDREECANIAYLLGAFFVRELYKVANFGPPRSKVSGTSWERRSRVNCARIRICCNNTKRVY
jgi:hypothetical protein